MDRQFFLHARKHSPIIDDVKRVAEPFSIFTEGWSAPVRTIPTIQFYPETNELIEGEDAIRSWLESIKPRTLARERIENLPPIKTKPVQQTSIPEAPKPVTKQATKPAPQKKEPRKTTKTKTTQ